MIRSSAATGRAGKMRSNQRRWWRGQPQHERVTERNRESAAEARTSGVIVAVKAVSADPHSAASALAA